MTPLLDLTPQAMVELEELFRTTLNAAVRARAQTILLAAEKRWTTAEIAEMVHADRDTVERWLTRYAAAGIASLREQTPETPLSQPIGQPAPSLPSVMTSPKPTARTPTHVSTPWTQPGWMSDNLGTGGWMRLFSLWPGGMVARTEGLLGVAFQRFRHQLGLTILALISIVLAVGLVTSAGFFSQAVDQGMLNQQLAEFSRITGRKPFSMEVYLFPPPEQPMSLQKAEETSAFVAHTLASAVGLPVQSTGLLVHGGNLALRAVEGTTRYGAKDLQQVMLTYIADVMPQLTVVAGLPLDGAPAADQVAPVWVHSGLAEEMGIQVGERFRLDLGDGRTFMPIEVAGLWVARDAKDVFWLRNPDETLRQNLLVRREDYLALVEPRLPTGTRYVDWHIVLNEEAVVPDLVRDYLSAFDRGLRQINRYLPEARLIHPQNPLQAFVRQQNVLTLRLLAFNIPAFAFLLYFLSLVSAIIVRWQRSELSILISRGVGVTNILLLTLFEQGLDFIVGAPLGIALGMALARLMGFSAGVLSFQTRDALPVTLRGMNPLLVAAALAVALVARLLPTWQAARQTVVQQERERTRQQETPFWYRFYLDLLLILPTAYLYRQIGVARALSVLLQAKPQDIYRDPLLVLVPALFVLTGGLLAMRLFPLFMRLLDILAGYLPFITPYLALRQLGRQSQSYISPLLLIIVSLALGVYTFSMLGSLDQWMVDRLYYQNGADVSFSPIPMGGDVDLAAGAEWIPPPEDFAQLPGVQQATRVGRYRTEYLLQGSSWAQGTFLGVDYLDFPSVAWFRRDLAEDSLGSMMNLLAVQPDGVLVSERFLAASSLAVGDRFPVRISLAPDVALECTLAIVGAYRYFPTTDIKSETVIGNLEYLYTYMGVPFQHDIWIRLRPGASGSPALAALKDLRIAGIRRQNTPALIAEERARLEQVGVLGTLSIGLLAAGGMAIIGLLIYGFSSMRERAYRFGVLRALGLSMGQAIGQVAGEYGVLTLYGTGAGAAIGAAASTLFMPFFGTAGQGPAPLPPLLPVLVGSDIVLIASSFAALTILLQLAVIALAVRRMLFQLLRMG